MLVAALCLPLPGLASESKYFLVRFVQTFGEADLESLGVKAYAKRFGLADCQVSAALGELVRYGCLEYVPVSAGRGRPKRLYRCTADLLGKLRQAESRPCLHLAAIEGLIQHERRDPIIPLRQPVKTDRLADLRSKRGSAQLSIINRVLLAILLCHADRFGVVRDLGTSAICNASGLNKTRFASRLQQLIRFGRVRSYVAGASSNILATRVLSTYILNLNHPDLSGGCGHSLLLVSKVATCTTENEFQHGRALFRDARKYSVDKGHFGYGTSRAAVLSFFAKQQEHVFQLLQLKLEAYAADVLSRNWADLASGITHRFPDLLARIRKDFSLPDEREVGAATMKVDIGSILHDYSLELARDIHMRLSEGARGIPLEGMEYAILPQAWGSGYMAIALVAEPRLSNQIPGQYRCMVISKDVLQRCSSKEYLLEAEIPLEERYGFGLLARPCGSGAA